MSEEIGAQACCILEICCWKPERQKAALAKWLHEVAGLPKHAAEQAADKLVEHWDFAPKGTLVAFKRAIAENAREYPQEQG